MDDNTVENNDEEIQLRDFLSRVSVRTMRKDLLQLREGQALKERAKIIQMKTPEEERMEREKIERLKQDQIRKETMTRESQLREAVLDKQNVEETEIMKGLKDYGSEEEKQKIFYFESENAELEKKLQALQKEQEPPVLLEKNKVMLERNEIEKRLQAIAEEEKGIEGGQKAVIESEKAANAPSDRQRLEKKRWEMEGSREKLEKKRWTIERELEAVEKKMQAVDEQSGKIAMAQKELKDKILANNASLRAVFAVISEREDTKRKSTEAERTAEALKRAEEEAKRKEEITRQQWTKPKVEEKAFAKDLPQEKKTKLAERIQQTAGKEEEERKKFLASIEEWAKEDKQNK